jgi:hypothetical protein
METADNARSDAGGLDLEQIYRIVGKLWAGRMFIATTSVITLLLAILYLHLTTFNYTTTLTLIPTQSQPRDVAGQFGGLAAMAGINLPGTGATSVSPFTVYPETAGTRQVAADMLRDWPGLMQTLVRDQWDPRTQTWHKPRTLRYAIFDMIRPVLGIPAYRWNPPGPAELQQYIAQNVGIAQDKKKAMLIVIMRAPDPDFSRKFILELHKSTDEVLRRMTLDRARKYSAYLANQLTTTQASAVRDVLTQSLSDQETLVMMGSSDTDFAAQPLAPPESSTRPTDPVPIFVLFFGLLAGMFIGGVCVVLDIRILEAVQRLGSRLGKSIKG